jgi:hypothetical protein
LPARALRAVLEELGEIEGVVYRENNVFLELRLQGKFKIVLTSECYGLDDAQTRVFYFDSSRADSSRDAGAAGSLQLKFEF